MTSFRLFTFEPRSLNQRCVVKFYSALTIYVVIFLISRFSRKVCKPVRGRFRGIALLSVNRRILLSGVDGFGVVFGVQLSLLPEVWLLWLQVDLELLLFGADCSLLKTQDLGVG